ncbi:hypothetical protein pEaSNUABM57_00035 [Erwinia phage pEa_SNUABM_57]|uniref:Uncharacterized protein n=1 Tax=Erwinia phage pEa_SNUABM_57 TaxID=2996118 RepID=A0A9E9C3V9_9CAUD|nr:hypothetical protein pEaSNUABM57_00035 [Erwinia phage pEa_SNUABM_57]
MRNIKTIEADISKLQAELADAKDHESMRDSAVHILKNLGWTRVRGQWVKPRTANTKVFDKDTMTHIKAGDFCSSSETSSLWYVRKVVGNICWCSRVTRIAPFGTSVTNNNVGIPAKTLTVIDARKHMGYVHK